MWENPFSVGGACGVYGWVVKIAVALKAFLKTLSLSLLHSAAFSHFCPKRSFAPKNVESLACACKNGHDFDALAGQVKWTSLLFLEKYGNSFSHFASLSHLIVVTPYRKGGDMKKAPMSAREQRGQNFLIFCAGKRAVGGLLPYTQLMQSGVNDPYIQFPHATY